MACAALSALALSVASAGCDLAHQGPRQGRGRAQNQIIGYGIVVGLNGTGDTLNNMPFTKQSLQAMLERMGVNIRGATIRTGNVAAVMVTGELPAFATQGTRMDVTVSALGDAKSCRAARCWSPPCSAPTATSTRSRRARSRSPVSRPRAKPRKSSAACRPSAASPTAPSSSARSSSHSTGCRTCAWRYAMPTSPPPSASPPRSTTISASRPPSRSTPRRCSCRSRRNSRAT